MVETALFLLHHILRSMLMVENALFLLYHILRSMLMVQNALFLLYHILRSMLILESSIIFIDVVQIFFYLTTETSIISLLSNWFTPEIEK
jgi:hypothetical protein